MRCCFLQRISTALNTYWLSELILPLCAQFLLCRSRALRFHSEKSCETCFFSFTQIHTFSLALSLAKTFVLIVIHVWLWHILAQFYARARTIPTISLSTALNIQFGKLTCGFYTKHKTCRFFSVVVRFEGLLHHHRRHQHHYMAVLLLEFIFTPNDNFF